MMARKVTRDNSMSNILIGISAQAELASTDPVKLEESRGHGIIASKLRDIQRREQEISKNVLNARKTDVANRVNDDNPDVFRRHGAEYVWSVIEQTIDANKDIASTDKLYSIVSSKLGKPVNQGVAEGMFTKAPAIDPIIGKEINNIINRLYIRAKRTKDEYLLGTVQELFDILRNTGGTYSAPGSPGVRDVTEGMSGQVVYSDTGANGGKYEIIQTSPTDFMIHVNGKHIDTYSSLQRAMSVLKNEVPGLQKGVAEGSVEEGVIDKVRAMNYDRLAKRSDKKVQTAFDKMQDFDFADPERFPHEKEFSDQMDKMGQRTKKANQLRTEQGVAEGLKDIATELGQVADNKDYETLRDLISSEGEIGKYLGDMITDFSAEKGLHPDDDEELEKLVMDRLIHEFGNQFDEAATTEELNQIRKLSGFAEAKLDPVGKEDDDLNNDGEVDSTDDYLKNRREKIAKSMKESVDLTECGMMPENMGMMHNTPATVTMTATASSGSEVSSMLKDILTLAGQHSHADAYVMDGGCSMEEDGGFAAATSGPNEFEASVEQQLQQGDDMHKPHEQHAAMAKLGDNPMASEDVDQLAESLWQQFNATK